MGNCVSIGIDLTTCFLLSISSFVLLYMFFSWVSVVPWVFSVEALIVKRGVPDRKNAFAGRRFCLCWCRGLFVWRERFREPGARMLSLEAVHSLGTRLGFHLGYVKIPPSEERLVRSNRYSPFFIYFPDGVSLPLKRFFIERSASSETTLCVIRTCVPSRRHRP